MNEYYTRVDGINGTTARSAMGWIMIALGLIMQLALGRMGYYAGLGVAILWMTSWTKKNPLLTLKEDHIDMKLALIAGRRLIRYTDISGVEQAGEKKAWLNLRQGSRVGLPWVALSDNRKSDLLRELRAKLESSATPQIV